MKRILFTLFVGMIAVIVTCGSLWAQATAQISGTARDQSGAVLPGVEIIVTQTDTGTARNTITNETGSYVLPNLAIGPYRLEAALPGFRTFVQTGIVLQVNSSPSINVVLEVGQVAETVEVQANATLVETRNVGVGQIVENERILELPLNGRQVTELISLAGAATPGVGSTSANRNVFDRGSVTVAGGLAWGLNYALDGANHNNPLDNKYMSLPFPDALQEFKVETSAMSAQSGGKSAGSVTLVTKSGTNEFHGNLFEFVRNGMFNARNPFATKRDTIKRNQFGGTLGGSIVPNKLFFFGAYQGTTIRQDPADLISFVPTQSMLAGDFTALASPACNSGRQITLRSPFVNNRIDPALFSKPSVALAAKLPRTSDPCGRIIYGNTYLEDDHMAVGRIDYQRSANHSIFGRYLLDTIHNPTPYSLNNNLLSAGVVGAEGMGQAFTLGDTYLIGSDIVHSIRFTGNRMAADKTMADFYGLPELGVKAFTYSPTRSAVSVTGGFNISSSGGPVKMALFAINDDLSVIRGNHQMAFGANGSMSWVNGYATFYAIGRASFNGQATGLGMADFFTGNVFEWTMGTPADQHKRSTFFGLYGADTWKVNQKLTLNYGLRWEPYFPMLHYDGSAIHFDREALRQGVKTSRFTNVPPGLFFEGDPEFPALKGMYNQWWNFSPRLGLAWDVNGDGRTSVRSSVGSFYDYPSMYYQVGLSNAPPWNPRTTINNVRFEDPWANHPGGDPFPMPYGGQVARDVAWPLYGIVTAMDYETPTTMVTQWNLSLQRQISSDWLVSATYLGSQTIHLWATQHLNPAVYIPGGPCTLDGVTYSTCSITGNTNQRRRFSLENPQTGRYFGFVNRIDSGGTASYNGLLLSAQRRAARGVTLNTNYTWSHCISDWWSSTANSGTGNGGYSNPDNRRFDRGNCSSSGEDRRHVFNLSAVAETPQFSSTAFRAVASGWRFSPILRILSGSYMQVTTSQDRALNGISGQRVDQIMSNVYGDKTVKNYLSPAAFALPALGTFGNLGAYNIRGPGRWQFDAALSRTFQFRESQKLELRAETFNLTNSLRMNNPVTNFNAGNFGQVTSAEDPRIMQFALKYFF